MKRTCEFLLICVGRNFNNRSWEHPRTVLPQQTAITNSAMLSFHQCVRRCTERLEGRRHFSVPSKRTKAVLDIAVAGLSGKGSIWNDRTKCYCRKRHPILACEELMRSNLR